MVVFACSFNTLHAVVFIASETFIRRKKVFLVLKVFHCRNQSRIKNSWKF